MENIQIDEAIKSQKPYVYLLTYPNGKPFYVGKGRNRRAFHHLRDAKNTTKNSHKLNVIRKILNRHEEVNILIDSIHEDDDKALQRELYLQFQYGFIGKKTGILTNKNFGKNGRKPGHSVNSNIIRLTYQGEEKTVTEWAEALNISINTMYRRVKRGWSIQKIIERKVPERGERKRIFHENIPKLTSQMICDYIRFLWSEQKNIFKLSKKTKISYSYLYEILQSGKNKSMGPEKLSQFADALDKEPWKLMSEAFFFSTKMEG